MSVYTRLTKEELEQLLNDYNIGDLIDIQGINEGITNSNFYLQTTLKIPEIEYETSFTGIEPFIFRDNINFLNV